MFEQSESKGKADNIDKLVSRRLKMRRVMLGMSQQDIGKAVDVSIQQVQKYEKATNRISSGKLFTIAKFLKVPITYFYEHSDESEIITNVFAEDDAKYEAEDSNAVTEKEIVNLIKAFSEIKSLQSRKKITELVKTMS
jgi:transcriptional regulator with XRE-family HTH domain